MSRTLLSPFIFVIHTTLQILNLALWGGLIIAFGVVKLILPKGKVTTAWNMLMHACLTAAILFKKYKNGQDGYIGKE